MSDLDDRPYNCTLEEEVQRAWYMNNHHARQFGEASRRNSIYSGIVIRVLNLLDRDAVCKEFHEVDTITLEDLEDEADGVVQFFGGDIRDAYDVRLALALARHVAALCRKVEKKKAALKDRGVIETVLEICEEERDALRAEVKELKANAGDRALANLADRYRESEGKKS